MEHCTTVTRTNLICCWVSTSSTYRCLQQNTRKQKFSLVRYVVLPGLRAWPDDYPTARCGRLPCRLLRQQAAQPVTSGDTESDGELGQQHKAGTSRQGLFGASGDCGDALACGLLGGMRKLALAQVWRSWDVLSNMSMCRAQGKGPSSLLSFVKCRVLGLVTPRCHCTWTALAGRIPQLQKQIIAASFQAGIRRLVFKQAPGSNLLRNGLFS